MNHAEGNMNKLEIEIHQTICMMNWEYQKAKRGNAKECLREVDRLERKLHELRKQKELHNAS